MKRNTCYKYEKGVQHIHADQTTNVRLFLRYFSLIHWTTFQADPRHKKRNDYPDVVWQKGRNLEFQWKRLLDDIRLPKVWQGMAYGAASILMGVFGVHPEKMWGLFSLSIAFDASHVYQAQNSGVGNTHTITGSNPALVVFSVNLVGTDTNTGCTWNGNSMTEAIKGLGIPGPGEEYLYYISGSNCTTGAHNVVVSYTGTAGTAYYIIMSFTGCAADQTSPAVVTTSVSNASGTSLTATLTPSTDNSFLVGGFHNSAGNFTAGTNTTMDRTSNFVGVWSTASVNSGAGRSLNATHSTGSEFAVMMDLKPFASSASSSASSSISNSPSSSVSSSVSSSPSRSISSSVSPSSSLSSSISSSVSSSPSISVSSSPSRSISSSVSSSISSSVSSSISSSISSSVSSSISSSISPSASLSPSPSSSISSSPSRSISSSVSSSISSSVSSSISSSISSSTSSSISASQSASTSSSISSSPSPSAESGIILGRNTDTGIIRGARLLKT